MTVTPMTSPWSFQNWVILSFLPSIAWRAMVTSSIPECGSSLDGDVHARRHRHVGDRVDGLGRGLGDVDQALVRPDLELLARLLVDVRRAQDRVALDPRRQR